MNETPTKILTASANLLAHSNQFVSGINAHYPLVCGLAARPSQSAKMSELQIKLINPTAKTSVNLLFKVPIIASSSFELSLSPITDKVRRKIFLYIYFIINALNKF
jgi:hypothetical protein